MENDTREVDTITFGIYSSDEIKSMAVCKVDNPKLCSNDKNSGYGTVYDPRMGTLENTQLCPTCGLGVWECVGHFAYIYLNECVIHPLYYKQVVSFLKCFCIKCYKLMITEEQVVLNNLNRIKGVKRFNKILERLEKIDICTHCFHPQPHIKHTIADNTISMIYKDKDKGKISITLQVDEIKKIFDNISNSDVVLLGFDPNLMKPSNLILTVFPVIPTAARPYVIAEGNMCDDDLTIQLVEIIKANNHLEQTDGVPISDTKKQKYLQSLKFRISTFYNNSCLAPETPVLMWDGNTKRADEIEWGDELVGDDGEKRIVQSVCSGEDDMYEITSPKSATYVVNSNHYLTLKYSGNKNIIYKKPKKNFLGAYKIVWFDNINQKVHTKQVSITKKRTKYEALNIIKDFRTNLNTEDIFDIQVKDYLKLSKSTKSRMTDCKLNVSVNWKHVETLIEPYILGLWLGDGNSNCRGFTTEDPEILQTWKNWASKNQAKIVLYPYKISDKKKYQYNYTYHDYQIYDHEIYRPDINYGIKSIYNIKHSPLKEILSKYDLYLNKHIPDDFLYNDEKSRLELLAGIIDTDGHVYNNGKCIEITQSNTRKKFIEQVCYLAKSLGFYASINSKNLEKDGTTYIGFRVYISGNISKIPTKLPRKKCVNTFNDCLSSVIKVKHVGRGKYNGFTVDKNHRFLLGDFTLSHNSGKADILA